MFSYNNSFIRNNLIPSAYLPLIQLPYESVVGISVKDLCCFSRCQGRKDALREKLMCVQFTKIKL